jgi:hypothetical protein
MTTTPSGTTPRLAYLTFVDETDGVMVGRPDNGSYALFPREGAEAVRRLIDGSTPADVADWYARTYGGGLDLDDFLLTLDELEFTLPADAPQTVGPPRVKFQRLGRALFSPLAWFLWAAVAAVAVVLMVRDPGLRPSYANLFFTPHLAIMTVALAAGQIPCVLLHESFHALAGRRLGLPSRLRIGRRYYYVVAETELDALHSVPRRKRYLPFLAGMLADVLLTAVLTIAGAAALSTSWPRWIGGYALAMAFSSLMRLLWQAYFYLETDLYFVITTATGCTDLQAATRQRLYGRWHRLVPKRWAPPIEERTAQDEKAARFYAPFLVAGYAASTAVLLWAGLPAFVRLWSTILHRIVGDTSMSTDELVDTVVFLTLNLLQIALLVHVFLRDRRAKRSQPTDDQSAESAQSESLLEGLPS